MNEYSAIEIVDKEGWRKSFTLDKAITFIGSGPGNDIVLQSWRGSGVAARQLQVIARPGDGERCRVVNLGSAHLTVMGMESRLIAPHSVGEITAGESIQFGDFSLILIGGSSAIQEEGLLGPAAVAAFAPTTPSSDGDMPTSPPPPTRHAPHPAQARASQMIGLSLNVPETKLAPDHPLSATIKVGNCGEQTGVQFKIEVEGLDPEIYEIGPAPILFPNAEREIVMRIDHPRGPTLVAGEHHFRLRVTAPQAYPGEAATVSQAIQVLPYYEHRLKVTDME
jgi:hypothetical protein